MHCAGRVGLNVVGFCVHALRTTAATNALEHAADIAKVQEWLGHANISTTRLYDTRKSFLFLLWTVVAVAFGIVLYGSIVRHD